MVFRLNLFILPLLFTFKIVIFIFISGTTDISEAGLFALYVEVYLNISNNTFIFDIRRSCNLKAIICMSELKGGVLKIHGCTYIICKQM